MTNDELARMLELQKPASEQAFLGCLSSVGLLTHVSVRTMPFTLTKAWWACEKGQYELAAEKILFCVIDSERQAAINADQLSQFVTAARAAQERAERSRAKDAETYGNIR